MSNPVALEAHWTACMASAAGGGKVTRTTGGQVLSSPVSPAVMHNCILPQRVSPDGLERLLEIGRLILAAYGRPLALFLSPFAGETEALAQRLSTLGWRQVVEQVVLVRQLGGPTSQPLPAMPPASVPSPITISEATDRAAWARLLTDAYEMPEALAGPLQAAWAGQTGDARYYLACLEGRPVGTGLSWRQGGTVGLYCGAVLPAFRRRGVERATLLRRLADAHQAGAGQAYLQTESGSPVEHLCRAQLGFDLAYRRSLWQPQPHLLGSR